MRLKILTLKYKKMLLTSLSICMGPRFHPLESHHVLQGWASKLSSWLPHWPSSPTHISCSKESDPIGLRNVTSFSPANMQ